MHASVDSAKSLRQWASPTSDVYSDLQGLKLHTFHHGMLIHRAQTQLLLASVPATAPAPAKPSQPQS